MCWGGSAFQAVGRVALHDRGEKDWIGRRGITIDDNLQGLRVFSIKRNKKKDKKKMVKYILVKANTFDIKEMLGR